MQRTAPRAVRPLASMADAAPGRTTEKVSTPRRCRIYSRLSRRWAQCQEFLEVSRVRTLLLHKANLKQPGQTCFSSRARAIGCDFLSGTPRLHNFHGEWWEKPPLAGFPAERPMAVDLAIDCLVLQTLWVCIDGGPLAQFQMRWQLRLVMIYGADDGCCRISPENSRSSLRNLCLLHKKRVHSGWFQIVSEELRVSVTQYLHLGSADESGAAIENREQLRNAKEGTNLGGRRNPPPWNSRKKAGSRSGSEALVP
ncbi:hypothetical protein BJY04DRAFT_2158 [Aspergillus karnatakaensis]|uniref:uncharacterized protein n=1 Tax=Aspergillus karnatakaensis TaxID=1810916 RepID=UPI003CCD2A06